MQSFVRGYFRVNLARFEEQNGHLSEVEVDEVLRLVGDVATKVSANNAVPSWVVFFVEFLLDKSGDVLFDVEFLHGLSRTFNGVLLHVLCHVGILDHGLPLAHFAKDSFCNSLIYKFNRQNCKLTDQFCLDWSEQQTTKRPKK